jgi:hypothetical protein
LGDGAGLLSALSRQQASGRAAVDGFSWNFTRHPPGSANCGKTKWWVRSPLAPFGDGSLTVFFTVNGDESGWCGTRNAKLVLTDEIGHNHKTARWQCCSMNDSEPVGYASCQQSQPEKDHD